MPQQFLEAFRCAACGMRLDLLTDGTISGDHREGCDQAAASDKVFAEAKLAREKAVKADEEKMAAAQADLAPKP